ncbi:MAG: GTPase domain-containing protein, partial [Pirellulaceae bacterium]|nr:GTPase domain-containing protein [Pirellulaceae bacterium]
MSRPELAHLELLAEVDALLGRLNRWADDAPDWLPAGQCRALVRRLADRAGSMRVRLDAPLVAATLGGSGTGKSALLNAILGDDVLQTGRSRPTTTRPTLVCRPDISPEMLGIDPSAVELLQLDLPALRDLVLVDCPDADTAEECNLPSPFGRGAGGEGGELRSEAGGPAALAANAKPSADNLSRLRAILPHCDVLLVVATQQKYRSARVADELISAARGARVVFVQTHADADDDVRDDWRAALESEFEADLPPKNSRGLTAPGEHSEN